MMGAALPPAVWPLTDEVVRRRLERSWRNQGKPIPEDFKTWPPLKVRAAWLELLRRQGFPVGQEAG